ncbi:DMT family transporter [Deferribacter abyssi]|uniref:DMT family transporter n=1 Tax=Deferribacter abyssi TaxID=213806 RepID=UPI003C27860A
MLNKEIKGSIFILIAAMLWGTTGTAQGLAPENASSAVIGTLRILIGGLALMLIAILKREFKDSSPWPRLLTFTGMIGVALYQITFFYGVKLAGVAVGTVVGIGSAPISAGILSILFLKEKIHKKWLISTILALLGLFFISFGGKKYDLNFNLFGILLALMAGFSYSFYTMISKKLIIKHTVDSVMAVLFLGGAILLSPILFIYDNSWIFTLRGIAVSLHLGLFATAISYMFFIRGLKFVKVSTTATLSLMEPLTATILGITILKEKPNFYSIIGITFIFIGIFLLTFNKNN